MVPTPADGSFFLGWGGACTGSGICTPVVNSDTFVVAEFGPVTATQALRLAPDPLPETTVSALVATPSSAIAVVRNTGGDAASFSSRMVQTGLYLDDMRESPLGEVIVSAAAPTASGVLLGGVQVGQRGLCEQAAGSESSCFVADVPPTGCQPNVSMTSFRCGTGSVSAVTTTATGIAVAGTFTESLELGAMAVATGGRDAFIGWQEAGTWQRLVVASPMADHAMSVAQGPGRLWGLVALGETGSIGGVVLPAGISLVAVEDGAPLLVHAFGVAARQDVQGYVHADGNVTALSDGGVIVAASFVGTLDADFFVARVAADGQVLWTQTIVGAGAASVTSAPLWGDEVVVGGGYCGTLQLPGDLSMGVMGQGADCDAFAIGFDVLTGAPRWSRRIGGQWPDEAARLSVADGGLFVGASQQGAGTLGRWITGFGDGRSAILARFERVSPP